jgi:hypothetical protein
MAASLPQEVTGNTVEKDEWGFNERISYCVYGSDYERYGPYPGTSSGQSSERGTKTQGQTTSVNGGILRLFVRYRHEGGNI